jgi:hypothetical protein
MRAQLRRWAPNHGSIVYSKYWNQEAHLAVQMIPLSLPSRINLHVSSVACGRVVSPSGNNRSNQSGGHYGAGSQPWQCRHAGILSAGAVVCLVGTLSADGGRVRTLAGNDGGLASSDLGMLDAPPSPHPCREKSTTDARLNSLSHTMSRTLCIGKGLKRGTISGIKRNPTTYTVPKEGNSTARDRAGRKSHRRSTRQSWIPLSARFGIQAARRGGHVFSRRLNVIVPLHGACRLRGAVQWAAPPIHSMHLHHKGIFTTG